MATFIYGIQLIGRGEDVDDAWENALDGFFEDPGDYDPCDYERLEDDYEGEY